MKKISILFLVLFVLPARAIIVSDGTNMCGARAYDNMYAVYEAIQYDCSAGQFLPADTLGCATCPSDYTCTGGTFIFNTDENQGLSLQTFFTHDLTKSCAKNAPHGLIARYEILSYACDSGYYLPAGNNWLTDTDGCTICPAGNFCIGGTYSFNETTDQGIAPATRDNGYNAPAGSATVSDCVPNIIQITWQGAELADVLANHAETCTYGGDVRTPVKAIHIPGMTFVGWTVAPQE